MNEKYEYIILNYLYKLLDLKQYEKELEDNKVKKLNSTNEEFKYFSLLSKGDISSFDDEEKKELGFWGQFETKDIFSNEELEAKCEDFINRTYKKYFFSNVTGEYIYYGVHEFDHMAPDDALTLGLNYQKYPDDNNDFSEEKIEQDDNVIVRIINDIQYEKSNGTGFKIAVLRQNEIDLLHKNNSLDI